jgi:hypothetical protein
MSFAPPRQIVPTARVPAPPAGSAAWARRRPWRLVIGPGGTAESDEMVGIGTKVMVRTRYLGSWTAGFEVAEVLADGYRLRRLSDGTLLPEPVSPGDVRPGTDGGGS